VYDVATNNPVAIFDKKSINLLKSTWNIVEPLTEDVIYKLNSSSGIREALRWSAAPLSIIYERAVSFLSKTLRIIPYVEKNTIR
jgi:hypothetical protein